MVFLLFSILYRVCIKKRSNYYLTSEWRYNQISRVVNASLVNNNGIVIKIIFLSQIVRNKLVLISGTIGLERKSEFYYLCFALRMFMVSPGDHPKLKRLKCHLQKSASSKLFPFNSIRKFLSKISDVNNIGREPSRQ